MNVKKGDLARYVGQVESNYGRFVVVGDPTAIRSTGEPAWFTEPPLFMPNGHFARCVADRLLRPLRGDDLSQSDVDALYAAQKRTEVV